MEAARPDGVTSAGPSKPASTREKTDALASPDWQSGVPAQERLVQVQNLCAVLAQAVTAGQVADAILAEGLTALGTDLGAVALLTEDGSAFVTLRTLNYSREASAAWARYPVDVSRPIADAVRARKPLFLETPPEREARYPPLTEEDFPNATTGTLVALPLLGEYVSGGIELYFTEDRRISTEERAFMEMVAQICVLALDRVYLRNANRGEANERRQTEGALLHVLSSARCLLWHGTVIWTGGPEARNEDFLWNINAFDETAAQRFLPLEALPGETYDDAWDRAKMQFPKNTDETHLDLANQTLASGGSHYCQEFCCKDRYGRTHWLYEDVLIEPLEPKRWRLVGVCTDITERKLLEEQLRQSQKMESIGRLAGGVAHDFNNLLTAILGYTQLAEMELPADSNVKVLLQNVQQAGRRAANLTQQLLAFARKQPVQMQVISLDALISESRKLLVPLLGETITIVQPPNADPGWVRVDPGQMEQALVNLAINARDAMPHGGTLLFETEKVTLPRKKVHPPLAVPPGEYVRLSVADTGQGIPEAILGHIFEPFFTTKEVGRGTGLGLATCYGIVQQSGGCISVHSAPGQGTRFDIYLPRVEAPVATEIRAANPSLPTQGQETILLVEDEELVREIALKSLQKQGYSVLTAENGHQAWQLAQASEEKIALLVTDVVMPQMSGWELAQQMAAAYPELRVLFISGYNEENPTFSSRLEPTWGFLQKPFTPGQLLARVRLALDARPEC